MEGLIRRLWADPHDARAWLVLADWLREHDDPRADDVVQTLRDPRPMAAPEPLEPGADDAAILLATHPLGALPCAGHFRALMRVVEPLAPSRRHEALALLERWLAPWPDEARQPTRAHHLTLAEEATPPWWWPLVRALGPVWTRAHATEGWVDGSVAFAPLHLLGCEMADGVDTLRPATALPQLRGLALRNAPLREESLAALLGAGHLDDLEQLVVTNWLMPQRHAPAAVLSALPRLRHLVIDHAAEPVTTSGLPTDSEVRWLEITGEDVQWTADVARLRHLEHLALGARDPSVGWTSASLHGDGFPRLRSLDLRFWRALDPSGVPLAEARVVGRLHRLGLPLYSRGDDELAAWADRPPLLHLRHLALPHHTTAEQAAPLLGCDAFAGAPLRSVDLRGTTVDEGVVARLLGWSELTDLWISLPKVEAAALRALAGSELWPRLRRLHLAVYTAHHGEALRSVLNTAAHRPLVVVDAHDEPAVRISAKLDEPALLVDTWHGLPQERVGGHGSSIDTLR
ncbi:MAG: hypothetical protein KTR31_36595 [Myxococcales bacterium]|nr:hypothetical protein [Myxococcales bacterium]